MKKWEQPKLNKLGLESTKETYGTCYCEQGEIARHGNQGCGGHHGGHQHNPGRPCPDNPQPPQKPQCNIPACPGFGPVGSITPGLPGGLIS